ncbi:MAG TPA: endonuclease/exonuclease/phosphatase family protein [Streptosporangiaceae bacterium]|nr:endonuclease/exonuclease/phosphatase family protein [Streptosporangiaceae bacterium]
MLSGRTWLWVLPEMIPPIAFVAVPLIGMAFAVPAASVDNRYLAPALALVLLGAGQSWSGIALPRLRNTGRSAGEVTAPVVIFVWNTQFWDQGKDEESFHRFLRAQAADVYLLQEYAYWEGGREVPASGIEKLAAIMPDHDVFVEGGLVTLAHRRLAPRLKPGVPETMFRTDILVDRASIALYNVHMPVPLDLGKSIFKADFYRFVCTQATKRKQAFKTVEEVLSETPSMLFFGGDFNSSPAMRVMRRLRRRYVDVMRSAKSPYVATWPAKARSLWRIDWAMACSQITVDWARLVDPEGLSDHAGQLCAIRPCTNT